MAGHGQESTSRCRKTARDALWILVSGLFSMYLYHYRVISPEVFSGLATTAVLVLLAWLWYERSRADAERSRADALQAIAESTVERIATHGLPRFSDNSGGYSASSVNNLHPEAFVVRVLRLMPPPAPLQAARESGIWAELRSTAGREINWKSESDVQHYVRLVIVELILMAGLDMSCSNEVTIVGMRPDIWVIVLNGRPVGILEVKKPRRGILEDRNVLGQVLDYLRVLRHQFGVRNPYAICTTYEQWRVCRLPESDNAIGGQRLVEATPVIDGYGDAAEFCAIMIATLHLMRHSPLDQRSAELPVKLQSSRAYMKVDKITWIWVTTAAITLDYSLMCMGTTFLLVQDLGFGAHGHAWLACSANGRSVCVLKIARRMGASSGFADSGGVMVHTPEEQLKSELTMWNLVNSDDCPPADLVVVAGKSALRMPFVNAVASGECNEEVANAVVRISRLGVIHRDLHWRHVRKIPGGPIVFIDFGDCSASVPVDAQDAAARRMLGALGLAHPDDKQFGGPASAAGGKPYAASETPHPRRRASSPGPASAPCGRA
jgi:hypothetical protein